MNKEDENKLSDSIIALYKEIKRQGERTDKQFTKVNLAISELRLSFMKLDEGFNAMRVDFRKYAQRNDERATGHETRITRLEEGSSYIAREPAIPYKKKKRK